MHPGGPSQDSHQAIDLAAGLDRVMGDHAMHLRVLGRFRADYRDTVARLRQALRDNEPALAQRVVHTLKGAAAMIEARSLRQLALETELALRELALRQQGCVESHLIDRLEAELARVLVQLDLLLSPPQDAMSGTAASSGELACLRAMLDTGDGAAPALLEARHAAFLAALGPERMRRLDAAVESFDFERALAVLEEKGGN
jgi:HPt (histidine-containing phosphotransfer) domain-containing protein